MPFILRTKYFHNEAILVKIMGPTFQVMKKKKSTKNKTLLRLNKLKFKQSLIQSFGLIMKVITTDKIYLMGRNFLIKFPKLVEALFNIVPIKTRQRNTTKKCNVKDCRIIQCVMRINCNVKM